MVMKMDIETASEKAGKQVAVKAVLMVDRWDKNAAFLMAALLDEQMVRWLATMMVGVPADLMAEQRVSHLAVLRVLSMVDLLAEM